MNPLFSSLDHLRKMTETKIGKNSTKDKHVQE